MILRRLQNVPATSSAAGTTAGVALIAACVLFSGTTVGASESTLIRVEEDWEVLITESDQEASSPQIINVVSPTQNLAGVYGMLELNHNTYPVFAAGGLQLQGRRGEDLTATRTYAHGRSLRHNYDRLRYTVGLGVGEDNMILVVKKVASKTWGDLKNDVMYVSFPHDGATLADYSPDFSAQASSVHVGAHRVASMYMTQSRRYYSDDSIVVDETIRYAQRYRAIDGAIVLDYYSSILE